MTFDAAAPTCTLPSKRRQTRLRFMPAGAAPTAPGCSCATGVRFQRRHAGVTQAPFRFRFRQFARQLIPPSLTVSARQQGAPWSATACLFRQPTTGARIGSRARALAGLSGGWSLAAMHSSSPAVRARAGEFHARDWTYRDRGTASRGRGRLLWSSPRSFAQSSCARHHARHARTGSPGAQSSTQQVCHQCGRSTSGTTWRRFTTHP